MMRKESSVCEEGRFFRQGMRFLVVLVLAMGCSTCATNSKTPEKTHTKVEGVKTGGTVFPNEKKLPGENILLEAPPSEDNALLEALPSEDNTLLEAPRSAGNALLEALPLESVVVSMKTPAESSIADFERDEINYRNPLLEESLGEENKEDLAEVIATVKEFTEKKLESTATERLPPIDDDGSKETFKKAKMAEETPPVIGSLNKRFIPVKLLEVPHSPAQKIETAIQVVQKPAIGVNIFHPNPEPDTSSPEPDISSQITQTSSPTPEDFPEVAMAPQKKVRIVTRKSPLRVRKSPNLNSKILTILPKGSLVPFIMEKTGWFKVEFSSGQMGWISQKYSQLVE